jgi:hypothetical protein
MSIPDGGRPEEIPPVVELVPADVFENAVRKIGVANACEWFGHDIDSQFTLDTIAVLRERSAK